LCCVFGGASLRRNLPIEHVRDHCRENFALPWREQFEARAQRCNFGLQLTSGSIPLQRELHRIQQVLITKRLGEKLDRSRLQGFHAHGDVALLGNQDNRDTNSRLDQLLLEIKPTYSTRSDVEDEATGYIRTFGLQKFLGGAEMRYLQSCRLDETLDGATHRWIVIHHENNRDRIGHGTPLFSEQSNLKKQSGAAPQSQEPVSVSCEEIIIRGSLRRFGEGPELALLIARLF
jgi:hypothetical protein